MHRFAVLVACSTFVLIFAGGLVTSTGSGLSVPDWPLSYGQVFPRMVGGILYEHSHRLVATTVGMLTIILAIWLWRREPRIWVRRLGLIALLAVICQGVLGGITVLFLLPTAVSVSHAGLAQLFMCLTISIALFTSRKWEAMRQEREDSGSPSLRNLTVATTVVIYIQILLGALMRHTASGLAIPDFPLSFGRLIPPYFTRQILVHFAHRVGALAVAALVIWVAMRVFRRHGQVESLCSSASLLLLVMSMQIFLGAVTVWSGLSPVLTTLHVLTGAFTLAASLYMTLITHRILLPQAQRREAVPAHAGAATE